MAIMDFNQDKDNLAYILCMMEEEKRYQDQKLLEETANSSKNSSGSSFDRVSGYER